MASGGDVPPDARCYLVAALLHLERHAEAQPYIDALLSEPDHDALVDEFLGESLELAGRYLDAIGVFAAGYSRRATSWPDEANRLLHGRRRCREALGLLPDLNWALELHPGEPDQEIVVFVTEQDWDASTAPLAPGCETVEAQFAALEQQLRRSDLGLPKVLVPVDVLALRETASSFGRGPDDEDMRLLHGLERARAGHGPTWPPGRDEACRCGRAAKSRSAADARTGSPVGARRYPSVGSAPP